MKVNLRSFKQKVRHNGKQLKSFLTKTSNHNSKAWEANAEEMNEEVWKEVDCLSCANCCKTMTPTFTPTDIKRISAHLNTTPKEFKEKWLHYDKKDNDWLNKFVCNAVGITFLNTFVIPLTTTSLFTIL